MSILAEAVNRSVTRVPMSFPSPHLSLIPIRLLPLPTSLALAKGTARSNSGVDIALFLPDLRLDRCGVLMDLESTLGRQIDLAMCLSDKFVEKIGN